MKADVISGYKREKIKEKKEYPNEYPFVLIKILTESEDQKRVATYVELGGVQDRESKLFVERSPPKLNWLKEIFRLIEDTGQRGITSGGLHEIRIDSDKIEVNEDEKLLIDRKKNTVYHQEAENGSKTSLKEWENESE